MSKVRFALTSSIHALTPATRSGALRPSSVDGSGASDSSVVRGSWAIGGGGSDGGGSDGDFGATGSTSIGEADGMLLCGPLSIQTAAIPRAITTVKINKTLRRLMRELRK